MISGRFCNASCISGATSGGGATGHGLVGQLKRALVRIAESVGKLRVRGLQIILRLDQQKLRLARSTFAKLTSSPDLRLLLSRALI